MACEMTKTHGGPCRRMPYLAGRQAHSPKPTPIPTHHTQQSSWGTTVLNMHIHTWWSCPVYCTANPVHTGTTLPPPPSPNAPNVAWYTATTGANRVQQTLYTAKLCGRVWVRPLLGQPPSHPKHLWPCIVTRHTRASAQPKECHPRGVGDPWRGDRRVTGASPGGSRALPSSHALSRPVDSMPKSCHALPTTQGIQQRPRQGQKQPVVEGFLCCGSSQHGQPLLLG